MANFGLINGLGFNLSPLISSMESIRKYYNYRGIESHRLGVKWLIPLWPIVLKLLLSGLNIYGMEVYNPYIIVRLWVVTLSILSLLVPWDYISCGLYISSLLGSSNKRAITLPHAISNSLGEIISAFTLLYLVLQLFSSVHWLHKCSNIWCSCSWNKSSSDNCFSDHKTDSLRFWCWIWMLSLQRILPLIITLARLDSRHNQGQKRQQKTKNSILQQNSRNKPIIATSKLWCSCYKKLVGWQATPLKSENNI